MSKVSTVQEYRLMETEDALARLGRRRHKDFPVALIRLEVLREMTGLDDLIEPLLEFIRKWDEEDAKSVDGVSAVYKEIGGKART